MKILIAVKRVADANVKVRPKSDGSGPDLNNVKMAINPFCEIAVEEAVRLKEKGSAEELVAVSIGPEDCKEQIRTALALGADRGVWISTETWPAPLAVAKLLKALVEREKPDIVLMGKQSIDGDNNQTPQMLAALCGYAQGTFISELEIADGRCKVVREIDGGLQTLSLAMPAILSVDLRLNEPRYASLPNIMKAKKKDIEELSAADCGVDAASKIKILKMEPPAERPAGVKVESVAELVSKLRDEAKVIS